MCIFTQVSYFFAHLQVQVEIRLKADLQTLMKAGFKLTDAGTAYLIF